MSNNNPRYIRVGAHRDPAWVLIVSLLTCGVYYLYWIYQASRDMIDFDGLPDTPPWLEVVLSACTFGLYTIFWDFKSAEKIARLQAKVGLPSVNNSLLYLALNLLGLGLIPAPLEQSQFNAIWVQAERNYIATGSYYSPAYYAQSGVPFDAYRSPQP